jgi:hypothetical protein
MSEIEYQELGRRQAAGYERTFEFVLDAVEDEEREPRPDWRVALHDLAQDLDRIIRRNAHPDDVAHARSAMHSLAGVWLSVEEAEALWVGDTP